MFATIIMMDIQKFLKKFNDTIRYSEFGNGYEIAFPFAFPNDDHYSSVFISEDGTGSFTITDNGNTFLYLENNGVDIEKHASRIKEICKLFHLTIDNGTVKGILGEYETNQTFTQLTNFYVGISQLAMLKYFD